MPKLIVLNGPLGIGKSTLAQKYADEHPLTLKLDIDEIRKHLSHWRERDEESKKLSRKMAKEMARISLIANNDVVISQFYRDTEELEALSKLAVECSADFYEVALIVPKEEAIKRFIDRGQAKGYPQGFTPGGLVDRYGGIEWLKSIYDEMVQTIDKRPNTIRISPKLGDENGTYKELLEALD